MRPLVVFGLLLLVTVIAACQPVAFCEDKNWDGTCDVNGGNTCQGCTQELAVGQTKQFTNENCSVNVTLVSIDDKGTLFSVNGKEITLKENEEEELEESRILLNKLQAKKANFSLKLECTKPCTTCSEKETCKGLEKGTCCEGICIPKESCNEQNGHICPPAKNCPGSWIPSTDSKRCCNTTCETIIPECSQKNGHICSDNQVCPVAYTPAADSEKCCPQTCEPEVPSSPDEEVAAPWKIRMSSTGNEVTLHFGEYGDTPVPGDYDGDGVTDLAVWRRYRDAKWKGPVSTWIIKQSSDDSVVTRSFGSASEYEKDVPVEADYDGDGKTDMAYFVVADNTWHIKQSSNGQTITKTWDPWPPGEPYSNADDDFSYAWYGEWKALSARPIAADYDGDGKADLMAFSPYNAQWKIQQSSNDQVITQTFGKVGTNDGTWHIYDIAIPADYDGDGKAELATRRPQENRFVVKNGQNITFGEKLGLPVPGDYDGDGKTDFAVFLKEPVTHAAYVTGDITAPGVTWPMRESNPTVMDDDGTYRILMCGESGFVAMPDAVYYAKSDTSPTSGFGEKRKIILDGCHSTMIKVPTSINTRFKDMCGVEKDIYLIYTEADSWPRPGVDFNKFTDPDSFAEQYHCSATHMVNNVRVSDCDGANPPACCNLPNFPKGNFRGNKLVLYASCDPDATGVAWTRIGPVVQLDQPIPEGSTPGNPYGEGHPQALYLDGKVYLVHYHHQIYNDDTFDKYTTFAVAADGEHFSKVAKKVGNTVSQEIQYLPEENIFLGATGAFGQITLMWAKDLASKEYRIRVGPWEGLSQPMPTEKECVFSPGFLHDAYGQISSKTVYVYANQWNANNQCISHEPGEHGLSDGGTWSLNSGDPFAVRVNLDIEESKCLGSMYRKIDGNIQSRTCTADGWSAWS